MRNLLGERVFAQSLDVRARLKGSLHIPALKLADRLFQRYGFFHWVHEVVFQHDYEQGRVD